jgi:hypothetical protein
MVIQAASNRYGVNRNATLDLDGFPGSAAGGRGQGITMSYHGFGIQIDNKYIGRITDWTPLSLDRKGEHIFELNPTTFGQPVDYVPGVAQNFSLAFARAEVWQEEIEKAFGETNVYNLLLDQRKPFVIDEVFNLGSATGIEEYRRWRYVGCWFTSKKMKSFTSTGDPSITIDGEIAFVNRFLVGSTR